jgi:hypothetical protein
MDAQAEARDQVHQRDGLQRRRGEVFVRSGNGRRQPVGQSPAVVLYGQRDGRRSAPRPVHPQSKIDHFPSVAMPAVAGNMINMNSGIVVTCHRPPSTRGPDRSSGDQSTSLCRQGVGEHRRQAGRRLQGDIGDLGPDDPALVITQIPQDLISTPNLHGPERSGASIVLFDKAWLSKLSDGSMPALSRPTATTGPGCRRPCAAAGPRRRRIPTGRRHRSATRRPAAEAPCSSRSRSTVRPSRDR